MAATIPTFDDLYAAAKAETQARLPSLTDFSDGSALDALTGGGCVLADMVIRAELDAVAAKYIAIAVGADLDTAVTDIFPACTRWIAAKSVGTLRFAGSVTGAEIPAGTVVTATVSGLTVTFTTDSTAWLDVNSLGVRSITVSAHCSVTGPSGNVAASVVNTLPTPIASDATITVGNPDRFVGGAAAESDDAYRARAQAYPLTLRRGTVDALEEGALTVPGVAYVTIDETMLATDATVYVYVGDPDGRGNAALAALVATELEKWRVAGVLVTTSAAARQEIDLTLVVTMKPGTGTDANKAAIRAAVLAYTDQIPAGGSLYLSAAESAAIRVSSDVLGAVASSTAGLGDAITPTLSSNALRVLSTALTVSFA